MGTPLSDEEKNDYAPQGGLMRKMLEDGLAPWPSVEEMEYEDLALKLLSGEYVTLPVGQKAGGRLVGLELKIVASSDELGWRVVHLDPPPAEDDMGAPDFPISSTDNPGLEP